MEGKQGADHTRLLTIQELSVGSRLSVSTLRRLVRARKIPYFQPAGKGGVLRFPANAIELMHDLSDGISSQPVALEETPEPKRLPGRQPEWTKPQSKQSEDQ